MVQRLFGVLLAWLLLLSSSCQALEAAENLPEYQRIAGVDGRLSSIGSDTLANLMSLWAEHFRHLYPNVRIAIQSPGSSTAPPALTESAASLGPMSRAMKDREMQSFEKRFGYPPTAIPVAIDALAIYVHKDNPIQGLTLAQIDALFSSTLSCGYGDSLNSWGELGLTGSWQRRGVQLYGRNSVSGTYGYFKQIALCNGDFRNEVNEQPGSASVVQAVASSLNGIGYSGIGYKTAGVRTVPIARFKGGEYIQANAKNAVEQRYPLSRFLYIYVNKKPNEPLPTLEREFLKMVLSREGQQIVVKDGYIPLPVATVNALLQSL